MGTAVAAFVGLAESGPFNRPTLVSDSSQFNNTFGGIVAGSYMAQSVCGYFMNGGGNCYVVRIGGDGSSWPALGSALVRELAEAPTAQILEDMSSGAVEPLPDGETVLAAPPSSAAPRSSRLSADDYVGGIADRTAFAGLEAVEEITMLCVPDLMSAYQQGAIDLDTVQAVQAAMIAHCELMGDRVAILDPPPGFNAQQINEWRVDEARYDSMYATLYWPWIQTMNSATGLLSFMPSGHVAGIWGRNDDTTGVHKAPVNEVVRGAIDLEINITRNEQDLLNPEGINCIRAFPGRGIRVWGARTLSSDAAWRYINVRRLFNFLEESIVNGTSWVVFEPNDEALWAKIRRTIAAFLVMQWRAGALCGSSPDEAFYVKCDSETNPGEVSALVRLSARSGLRRSSRRSS